MDSSVSCVMNRKIDSIVRKLAHFLGWLVDAKPARESSCCFTRTMDGRPEWGATVSR
jgi:hypothetical protein